MSVSLRKQRDKPSENRIFKKDKKNGNYLQYNTLSDFPKALFGQSGGGKFLFKKKLGFVV